MNTYREYIKSQPCCVCGDDTKTEQHHLIAIPGVVKGLALKTPEFMSIPVCRTHHSMIHEDLKNFTMWYESQEHHLAKTLWRAHRDGWRWTRVED